MYDRLKRVMDVAVSCIALLVALVPMGGIALAIRIAMGSPVLHRSTRPGLRGHPFVMYKFRTMHDHAPDQETNRHLTDAERLTRLGSFLRSTSLDELPELLNVIKGDMSLVGPRPLLMQYLERYSPEQARRHEVKPGITGWAQINGRNAITWEEKLRLDVWYVDHRSVRLDLRILFATFRQVVRREGVSAPGHATMPEFTGPAGNPGHGPTNEVNEDEPARQPPSHQDPPTW